ncbi:MULTISPECIES: 30S ribosomal protein S4 [Sulfurisphaera]|uniref:Small ribosomal subunit protein uS4 n=3 Tax=Sulfurisphaera TaxID=69655 RepID=RS4_SULTO|nr:MULTISPECIES: 30S ribosomal protein S4 [Sulfurisphaera]Q96YV8.1 RecName: Full=Small ribosomal subunit protein uS4; AltName: Full=30S ribosomal protein S4 [Sulfurisphaera tokodaii str. 7]MBB5253385.1 small subunit ribosomal protein S4 [Sulfurisphaera ohwakuensis]QGR17706.1 30S ribosomal protein S4 [Sulfurisphaera ohwakuensis]BAB67168.1 30S ribosomal protein S4P [Sulfurisphaera tokodaii str. 7]HII72900.1 30S ribosomal protein S4 [Sulfurisphaera tokodaii]
MGDPKKSRRKWEGPGHPWIRINLEKEQVLIGKYGLRNKRELWLAQTIIRKFRHQARSLLALPPAERSTREKQLIQKLYRMGIIEKDNATLDDILGLNEENYLERRLQTIVYKKGLARTIYQARQLIVHGHIAIGGRRVTSPGYIVMRGEEDLIDFYPTSPFKQHPPTQQGEENVQQA